LIASVLIGIALLGLAGPLSSIGGPSYASPVNGGIDPGTPDEITASFRINSDAELASKAEEVKWRGNGSSDNPYIIYNVNIHSSTSGFGIYIGNTTSSFIIYRCQIDMVTGPDGSMGAGNILLYNVAHATVQETAAYSSEIGISLIDCRNVTVLRSNDVGMTSYGLSIDGCDNISVSGGSFQYSGAAGIRVNGSQDVAVDGPSIQLNDLDGILIERSGRVMVSNITAQSNGDDGISVHYSDNIIIFNGTFEGGDEGISAHDSSHILISSNEVTGTASNGVQISGCGNVTVEDNSIYEVETAVLSETSSDISISGNDIAVTDYGIVLLDDSTRNSVSDNRMEACLQAGIYVQYSAGNVFYRNDLIGCSILLNGNDESTFTGQIIPTNNTVNGLPVVYLHDVDFDHASLPQGIGEVILGNVTDLVVAGQDLSDQNCGVLIGFSSGIEVRNCTFSGLDPYGAVLYFSDNVVLRQNTFYGCGAAAYLAFSDANVVERNEIERCVSGVLIYGSSDNLVNDNVIADCSDSGVLLSRSPHNNLYGNALLRCSFNIGGDNGSAGSQTLTQSNTVNGRPVYLFDNVDMNHAAVPSGAGQVILWNVQHAAVSGQNLSDQNCGLLIGLCSNITVEDCIMNDCSRSGVLLVGSDHCLIERNQLSGGRYGIYIDSSNDCAVYLNDIEGCGRGIYVSQGSNVEIDGNSISCAEGIRLYGCQDLEVHDNAVTGAEVGIYLLSSENNTVRDNLVEDCHGCGVLVLNSSHNVISGNRVKDCSEGINLEDSTTAGNLVAGNDISGGNFGIRLYSSEASNVTANSISGSGTGIQATSSDGIVSSNNITGCRYGIHVVEGAPMTVEGNRMVDCALGMFVQNGDSVTVSGNYITGTGHSVGIEVDSSTNVNVSGNSISGCVYGIFIFDNTGADVHDNIISGGTSAGIALYVSSGCMLEANTMTGCSIDLDGAIEDVTSNEIAASNTVNGRPVYFYKNGDMSGVTIPDDAGEIILASVANCTISGYRFDNSSTAIEVLTSGNVSIEGCSLDNMTAYGIYAADSSNLTVTGCDMRRCAYGVLAYANMTRITVNNNTFQNCTGGIFSEAWGERVRYENNTLTDCQTGISLGGAAYAQVRHNQLYDCDVGIFVSGDHNSIVDNIVSGSSSKGVYLEGNGYLGYCNNNHVVHNYLENCSTGVFLQGSYYNYVENNTFNYCAVGIGDAESGFDIVRSNVILYSEQGIAIESVSWIIVNHNHLALCNMGMNANGSQHLFFNDNTVEHCGEGIILDTCNGAYMERNAVNGSAGMGISVYRSQEIVLHYNTISNSTSYGLLFNLSENNEVSLNRFVANNGALDIYDRSRCQAYDDRYAPSGAPSTAWSSDSGNLWSDLTGPDADRNGYVDVPYHIAGGDSVDARPLAQTVAGPADLAADAYHDHVVLSWSGYSYSLTGSIDGYWLIRNSSAGENFTAYIDSNVAIYNDTTVEAYAVYTYTLIAHSGDIAGTSAQITVVIPDPYPPVIEINGPIDGAAISSPDALISWTGTDIYSGIGSYWVSVNGGEWFSVGLNSNVTLRHLPEGANTVTVKAVANAGNTATATVHLVVDTVLPAVTIVSPSDGSATSSATVTWQCSDASADISYEVSLDGGEWTSVSSTSMQFTGLYEGRHAVRVMATDRAGNQAVAEVEFVLDSVAPTILDRYPEGERANVDTSISVTFSEEMNASSANMVVSGVIGTVSWNGNTLIFDPISALEAGGTYTVAVSGRDMAGNHISESWSFTVTVLATLSGQILDAEGRPVAGAAVTLDGGTSAVTDTSGRFSFELPAGRYNLTVAMKGYQSAHSMVVLAAGQSMSLGAITLDGEPSGDLYWAVLDVLVVVALIAVLLYICRRR
jgi:parallel beta-helix repeat protein